MKLLLEVHTVILTTSDLQIQFAYDVTINFSYYYQPKRQNLKLS